MNIRNLSIGILGALFAAALATTTLAAPRVGEKAPDFTAIDSNGQTHTLSEYAGKYVVLEWTNRGCPYTRKHYESGNMQRLQQEWTARGVIWLSVISSAPGEQGYVTAAEENEYLKQSGATPTAALLDPKGALGHLYDAKTTPDMYIVSPKACSSTMARLTTRRAPTRAILRAQRTSFRPR